MENCLQTADHWVTIGSGIFTVILTIVATWLAWNTLRLTKRDEQKTIAINELQAQTEKLEELYLYQVQPRFTSSTDVVGHFTIVNVGGDCDKLKISVIGDESEKSDNPFVKWDDFFSSSTARQYSPHGDKDFLFVFEDIFGNKMEQIFSNSTRRFSNVKKLS